jgi:hypothetical protein
MSQKRFLRLRVDYEFASNNSGWRFQPEIAVFAPANLLARLQRHCTANDRAVVIL